MVRPSRPGPRTLAGGRPPLRPTGLPTLVGIAVLVLLAVGLVVGSRIPHKLGNRTNPQFLGIWLGVFLLIFFLLSLAMIDWLALRIFARRHRKPDPPGADRDPQRRESSGESEGREWQRTRRRPA